MRQKDKRRQRKEQERANAPDPRPILAYHAGPLHLVHCVPCTEHVESPHGIISIRSSVGFMSTNWDDLAVRCYACRRALFNAEPDLDI